MRKTILIVDDSPTLRRSLIDYFENDGRSFLVCEAVDGVEAIEKVSEMKPDLIVMDLAMPRLNGIDASKRLRELKVQTPIILFTLSADSVSQNMIANTGIDSVISKADLPALWDRIETLLPNQAPDGLRRST